MSPRKTIKQLCVFGLVGSVAAAVNLALVILLVEKTPIRPLTANPLAFIIAFLASYIGHYHLTFKSKASHKKSLPRFFLSALIGLAINQSFFYISLKILCWHYVIALLTAIVLAGFSVFILGKYWSLAHD